jgi:molybdate transport system ATP-binding protein
MKTLARTAAAFLGVELQHIGLQRGGRRVLRDVHWRIRPGERWLLLGENGAGKTQLLKLLAGDVWPQPGRRARRIYTWQREQFTEPLLVREEIAYLGAERQDRYDHYHWNHRVLMLVGTGRQRTDIPLAPLSAAERRSVLALLRRCGLAVLAQRRFLSLSYGERRLVLLARALAWQPRLLLLDEPLNGLDAANRRQFLQILQRMQGSALPMVYATHRLDEVPAGMTHLAVLEDGRLRVKRVHLRPRAPAQVAQRRSRPAARAGATAATGAPELLLQLVNASVWRERRAVLRGVSLELRRGDRVVVHGANGSGKTTLLGALYGEHAVASGAQVWRRGMPPGTPLYEFQRRVGRLSPELQLALPRQLTALETVVAGLRDCFRLDAAMTRSERRCALRALRRVGAASLAQRELGTLSYGQARRVLFARALAGEPWLLLLDEPYTGLDAKTRRAMHSLVNSAGLKTLAIVMATHHRDDWPSAVTREIELTRGVVPGRSTIARARIACAAAVEVEVHGD